MLCLHLFSPLPAVLLENLRANDQPDHLHHRQNPAWMKKACLSPWRVTMNQNGAKGVLTMMMYLAGMPARTMSGQIRTSDWCFADQSRIRFQEAFVTQEIKRLRQDWNHIGGGQMTMINHWHQPNESQRFCFLRSSTFLCLYFIDKYFIWRLRTDGFRISIHRADVSIQRFCCQVSCMSYIRQVSNLQTRHVRHGA